MSKEKFGTYCRIFDFLDEHEPDFASILHGTCLDGLVNRSAKSGVTVLIPKDEEYKKELFKAARSADHAVADKAVEQLKCLIIYHTLPTSADWVKYADDIPNAALQRVQVSGADGESVKFKNGAVATPHKEFAEKNRGNKKIALWNLKGKMDLTTDMKTAFTHRDAHKQKQGACDAGIVGGYNPPKEILDNLRFQIMVEVENAQAIQYKKAHDSRKGGAASVKCRDVYLEYVLSLVQFLQRTDQWDALYGRVLPLVSLTKVDLYFLLEPFRRNGQYLLSNELISQWYSQHNIPFDIQSAINNLYDLLDNSAAHNPYPCALYQNRSAVITAIDGYRQELSHWGNPKQFASKIHDLYNNLVQNNSINGVSSVNDVLPEPVAAWYRANPCLKLIHDELRYTTYIKFAHLEIYYSSADFEVLIDMISEYLSASTEQTQVPQTGQIQNLSTAESVLRLLNKTHMMVEKIASEDKYARICMFTASSYFMFIPLTRRDIEVFPLKDTVKCVKYDNRIFNIHKIVDGKARLISGMAGDNKLMTDVLKALAARGADNLDPEIKQLLAQIQ